MFMIGKVFANLELTKIQNAWNVNIVKMHLAEGAVCSCSTQRVLLRISQSLQERTCAGVSSLMKKLFIKKETPIQKCTYELCEIFN